MTPKQKAKKVRDYELFYNIPEIPKQEFISNYKLCKKCGDWAERDHKGLLCSCRVKKSNR